MKLVGLYLFRCKKPFDEDPVVCAFASDVSNFGMFQRSSAREFLLFISRTVAKAITDRRGTSHQVQEGDYTLHAYAHRDGIVAVAVADAEYPMRVAATLLLSIANEFAETKRSLWDLAGKVSDYFVPSHNSVLEEQLKKYQDPTEADKLCKIQKELAETKIIMHQAIDNLLQRGEKIDDLVEKSNDLGAASKTFYKTAKKNNSCCVLM